MQALIEVTSNESGEAVVSARELHLFLESRQDFSTWIKARIEKYGFIEKQDYTTFHKSVERQRLIEYALTLDTAKELAMVEANDKGKQARQYFIACEKVAKQAAVAKLPSVRELAQMVIDAENAKEEAERKLALQQPRYDYATSVLQSESYKTTNEIALELGLTAQELNNRLAEKGVQYKQNNVWMLYATYRPLGYAKTRTETKGKVTYSFMVWSEKGRAFIHSLLNPVMVASIEQRQQSLNLRINKG